MVLGAIGAIELNKSPRMIEKKELDMRKFPILLTIAVILVACILLLIQRNTSSNDNNYYKIRVGYKNNSGYQNYFVAQKNGLFKRHGLEVEGITFQSTNQMMQALVLGQIDATAAGSIEVIGSTEIISPDAINIYLTLVFEEDNAFFSVLVSHDSGIENLSDLKGKKVGTLPGSTSETMLKFCLKHFLKPEDVEIIQLEPRLQLQALSAGQVDALYTVDPIITLGKIKGISKVLVKGPENQYMFNPMATGAGVISSEFSKNKPEATKQFIKAMNDSIDFMRKNEDETRTIIATETKLDISVADQMNLIKYWKLGETQYELVQKYLDFLYEGEILTEKIRAKDLYLPL